MIRTVLLPIAAGILLSGCATSYQSSGLTGGHQEQKAPGKLELVGFSGNGFISTELVQVYATYRCAELAKSKNKPFFVMYNTLVAAALNKPSATPRVGSAHNKPIATTFVLMLDAPRPGANNTDDVLTDLKKIIDSGKLEKSGT